MSLSESFFLYICHEFNEVKKSYADGNKLPADKHFMDFSISLFIKFWSTEQFPVLNLSWLLCKNWEVDPKIHMEIQGTQNSHNNLEEEQSWRSHMF